MFINNIKIIAAKNINIIAQVKSKLALVLSIINIRLISFYLGLKIEHNQNKQIIKFF